MQRCSYASYRDGSWQSNATATAPYRLTRDLQTNAFVKGWAYGKGRFWGTCDEGFPATYTRPAVKQSWVPKQCELRAFDRDAFCRRLTATGRPLRLLFVGDSYTGQLFISLLALLGGAVVKNEGSTRTSASGAWAWDEIPISELRADGLACINDRTPPVHIQFTRNENIETNLKESTSRFAHRYPFTHQLGAETLLLTQATAWFHTDGAGWRRNLGSLLNESARKIGDGWQQRVVVFSASYGHFNCSVETGRGIIHPVKAPKPGQHDYPLLNSIGERMAAEAGVTWLDISTPLSERPDGHMPADCGHWCLPGPYDIAAQLLFNALTGHIEGAPVAGAQNKASKGRGRGKVAGGRGRAPTRSVTIPRGRGPLRGKAPAT